MILDPTTDTQCIGQLVLMARELAPTTLIRDVAQHLGSPRAVVAWLQSLPQTDDDGAENIRSIACDVSQRVRLFPDDPNCFERAFAALTLLEVLDPSTPRTLVTIDRPLRHTGVVEKRGAHWTALDLFPRRNAFDWGNFGYTALDATHQYVGKPVLKFYLGDKTGGKVADAIGGQEQRLKPRKQAAKKRSQPAQQSGAVVARADAPVGDGAASAVAATVGGLIVANATKGGTNGSKETQATLSGAPAVGASAAAGNDPVAPSSEAKRWWWWNVG